ncbi:arachidonate 5-lipoxygenase-activating protein isoform X1 [Phocoena sinus]|uniref:arachidonate 5-lipoxygenase-activating protein isoform X1 n=1 Tax=Phocoena sinus TaxID=42100 RepID=UPI0013C4F1FB|nr:arachidonate 5-lipoxygenase-activating protein isoform X1 [Phocoena sinus]
MDYETLGNVVLLAIVTLISVVQNGFFAHKLEHESKTHNGWSFQRTGTLAFERVYTANQNCVDAYPTFLVTLWSAGLLCSQVPAAFAGLMYLVVRQKYFVGYLGERTQRTVNRKPKAEEHSRLKRSRVLAAGSASQTLLGPGVTEGARQWRSTRGYIFGKRIILFLFLMSLAGILNYFLILLFGSDFENYMKTIANTISPLLLIP